MHCSTHHDKDKTEIEDARRCWRLLLVQVFYFLLRSVCLFENARVNMSYLMLTLFFFTFVEGNAGIPKSIVLHYRKLLVSR